MKKKRVSVVSMFQKSIYKWNLVFDIFEASTFKVLSFFLLINLFMFLPITWQVANIKDVNFERYGITVLEDIPDWLPSGIPTSCEIRNNYLDCGMDHIFEYEVTNRDTIYTVYFNVPSDVEYDSENTIIFYHHGINMNFREGIVLRLTYSGFGVTDFGELHTIPQEEAAAIILENLFQSMKPVLILPIILFFVGALFLTNLILILALAGLSMLFSFNQSQFPKFSNMFKLFVMASTIPSIINIFLGFAGMSAFTSITYNIVTPFIALFMYKASRREIEINS